MPLSDEQEKQIRKYHKLGHGLTWDEGGWLLAAYDEQRAENERLQAQVAAAWDNGHREGVQDGESGYVAGTERRLRRTRNPHIATCEHTEHAIGSGGRVGRTFQGTSDPAGRWERCDGHEVHDV